MNSIIITYIMSLGAAVFGLILLVVSLINGASITQLDNEDIFVFGFAIASFFLAYSFSLISNLIEKTKHNESLHQAIGGYIPNKELNELVKKHFLWRGGTIRSSFPSMKFTTKWKDTERLKSVVDSCTFNTIIAQNKVICKVEYKGQVYQAASASKEMALCIAFLKSCNVSVD